jgi:diaminopimelate decarboxylase
LVLPETAHCRDGHLLIGGCDTVELAREFGTPLYVFDEATLRRKARSFCHAFTSRYPDVLLCYAAKAFLNPWLARLLAEEGLGLDVVSGGEMQVAHRAGFPMERVHLHGNNKLADELAAALDLGVGRVVVDNFTEIPVLESLAKSRGKQAQILLRIAPGVEAHTHDYLRTGGLYSKFGIPVMTGQAAEAVSQIVASPWLNLVGFHAHIGSQIFDLLPFQENVATLMDFGRQMRERHEFDLLEISPGGGWGIQYQDTDDPPEIEAVAETITATVRQAAESRGMDLPRLVLEPGRSLVGQAGVTLYTVGAIKDIPRTRKYVSVDGGMADNIRPALYQAKYQAIVANRAEEPPTETVTLAGKYCESGDVLIDNVELPRVEPGDIIVTPATGAYCIPMASNYNLSPRPAIVAVKDGHPQLVRRRETIDDLLACEVA